jgi:hypothetical protein
MACLPARCLPRGPLLNPLFTGSGCDGVSGSQGSEMTIEMRQSD